VGFVGAVRWVAVSGAQVGVGSGGFQGLPVMAWRSAVMMSAPCLRAVSM
jgi:hypothetical protein